jgi:hypothetical protein
MASVSVDLDRAPLDTYQDTECDQQSGRLNKNLKHAGEQCSDAPTDNEKKTRARVRDITKKVQSKLHLNRDDDTLLHDDHRVLDEAEAAPILAPPASTARDDDRLFKGPPKKPSGPSLKEVATHPFKTLKSAVGRSGGNAYAENLAKTDITHGANVNIIRAYDSVAGAQTVTKKTSAMQDLDLLKKSRQDAFVRWTLDRHVQRVRRAQAIKLPQKSMQDFISKANGGRERMQWKEYGIYVCAPVMLS